MAKETYMEYRCPYCGTDKGDESNNFCCSECHCEWVAVCEDCGYEVDDCQCPELEHD